MWADTLQGVLRILGYVLDVETTPLLAGSHDNPSESGSQMSAVRLILSAKELACEVLGNLCYTEGEVWNSPSGRGCVFDWWISNDFQ